MIHERAGLSVLTSLITNPKGLTFGNLKQLCGLTDATIQPPFTGFGERRTCIPLRATIAIGHRQCAESRCRAVNATWNTFPPSSKWFEMLPR